MRKTPANKTSLTRKANAAMRDAVAKVVEEHRRDGRPLAVWQDGKAVLVPAGTPAVVRERPSNYKTRRRIRPS